MKINDIYIDPGFGRDWERLPDNLKRRLDRKIFNMVDSGEIINSLQAHKVKSMEDPVWIGYLSMGKGGWRVLFEFDTCGNMYLLHVLPHAEVDKLLNQFVRYS